MFHTKLDTKKIECYPVNLVLGELSDIQDIDKVKRGDNNQ